MDTPDLAALVPELMAQHPTHHWAIVSGTVPGEYLRIRLHPTAAPTRVVTIKVLPGAEVFCVDFAGHSSHDFAYEDPDRRDLLEEQIALAVAATVGPTRVTLERAGGMPVASTMVVNPESPNPRRESESWPLRRLKAHVRGRRITREVLDFPRPPDA